MDQTPTRRGTYRAPSDNEVERLKRIVGGAEMPKGYAQALAEYCADYRRTDRFPIVEYSKLVAKPNDQFRMFPKKCRRALGYASADAKLVFWALWDQHEDKAARANGLLSASTEWFIDQTGISNRNRISTAVLELEVRGLIRVNRGRGGSGRSYVNMFQLTAFPDCLGEPPTADYETQGLPESKSLANDPNTVRLEENEIAARFNARISAQIEIVRYTRNTK